MSKIKLIILFLAAVFISIHFFGLKRLGYEKIPSVNETFDERAYALVGYTFRTRGIPTGWSILDTYDIISFTKNDRGSLGFDGLHITANGQKPTFSNRKIFRYPATYPISTDIEGKGLETNSVVQPYADHSPLAGFIYSLGLTDEEKELSIDNLEPSQYRLPTLYLSFATGILIFALSYVIYKSSIVAVSSLLIYSLAPTYIFSSRLALLENVLVPFSLASMTLLIWNVKHKACGRAGTASLAVSGLFAGFAILAKITGAAVLLAGLSILYIHKVKIRNYFVFMAPALFVAASFYLYVLFLSPELLIGVLFNQVSRDFFGPLNFVSIIPRFSFKDFPLDGYWVWGFASLLLVSINFKKHRELVALTLGSLVVYLFSGALNAAWYAIPFIPFMVIASGYEISKIVRKKDTVSMLLFFLLPFSSSLHWGFMVHREGIERLLVYRGLILLFMGLVLYEHFAGTIFRKHKKYLSLLWYLAIVIIFYQTIQWNVQSMQFLIENWGSGNLLSLRLV